MNILILFVCIVSLLIAGFFQGDQSYINTKVISNKDEANLKDRLTPLQYQVTQNQGTERSFKNEFWDNKKTGTYSCVVCDQELFDSQHKYDSGTGWPSFYQFAESSVDKKLEYLNVYEVHCSKCKAHLGHQLNDGPRDKTGLRYCINSASLTFKEKQ